MKNRDPGIIFGQNVYFNQVSSDNTAQTFTISADADERWVLDRLDLAYEATPTGGLITIKVGTTTVYSMPVTQSGPIPMPFYHEDKFRTDKNELISITMTAGGSGIASYISGMYH